MLFALLSLFSLVVPAVPNDWRDTTRQLLPVEVIASSRMQQQMVTHQQWNMGQRDWQRQGAVQFADVLRRLPGVQLRDYGGAGAQISLASRGLGAAHTVVSLDGFPVTDFSSGTVDLGRFRLSDFGQVQWTIADAPALLTSVRSLGTAHLALSSASSVPRLGVEWGSFGQIAVDAAAHHRSGAHTLGVQGSYARADNDFPYRVANGDTFEYARRSQSPWQRWQGSAHWLWQTPQHNTQVRLNHQQHMQQLPGAVTLYTTLDGEELRTHRSAVQASHVVHGEQWQWQWAGQYAAQRLQYIDRGEEYPGAMHEEDYHQYELWNTLGARYDLSSFWQVAYAVDASHTTLRSNIGRFERVGRAALQQSVSLRFLLPTTMFTLRGLRHDFFHTVLGHATEALPLMPWESTAVASDAHELTWSVSAAQQLWQTRATRGTLRGLVQTLFRMPSFTENYYHHYGNAGLRPERTQQFSLGLSVESIRLSSSFEWKGSVDVYHNRVLDRIMGIPVNQTVWRTTNLDRVRAWGGDVAAQLQFKLAPGHSLEGAVTTSWQSVVDDSERKSATYGLQLPYIPEATAHAVVVWSNPWCDFSLTADYASERHATANHWPSARLEPYATLHVAVGRNLRWGCCNWHTQFVVNNLTNAHYELVRGYPLPGRSVLWRNTWLF